MSLAPSARNRLAGFLYGALILIGLAALVQVRGGFIIEDDARYYTVIAENIARDGRSTFDGQVLTNGYHPLWMVVLVAMAKTVGLSDAAIVAVELLLTAAGVMLLAGLFRSASLALRLVFATLFAVLATPLVGRGMEVSIFIFCFALFAQVLQRYRDGEAGAVALGVAAGLAIGARLDAAVFVVPMLLLVAGLRGALVPLLVMGVGGALYAGFNHIVFGIAFPVSGAIKSLGGVQVNARFLKEFAPLSEPGGLKGLLAFARSTVGKMTVLAGLGALVLLAGRHRATPWVLGFLVGIALYFGKLTFGSSWAIWSWYGFPMFIGLFVVFLAADGWLARRGAAEGWHAMVLAGLIALAGAGWIIRSNRVAVPPGTDFEEINKLAAQHLAPLLQGARVAMGDRAGSFAHHYPGPVTQTEGLVNDRAFYEALKAKGDVKGLLCRRGVRYFIAYQVDLGAYDAVRVPVLRRMLTQYEAPALTLRREDEVARVFDLARFDASRSDEGDSYLYVWRLSDCPAP